MLLATAASFCGRWDVEWAEGGALDSSEKRPWALGRCMFRERGFEYLRKVRYSPQVPRPSNARADASEKEAFKEVSPSG